MADSSLSTKNYSHDKLNIAIAAIKCKENPMTVREASCAFSIPKSTLYDAMTSKYNYRGSGKKRVLSDDLEEEIVKGLVLSADKKLVSKRLNFRIFVKDVLDINNVKVQVFKNNVPGERWAREFLKRHKSNITERLSNAATQTKLQLISSSPENIEVIVNQNSKNDTTTDEFESEIVATNCKENLMLAISKQTLCNKDITSKENCQDSEKKQDFSGDLDEEIVKNLVLATNEKLPSKRLDFRLFVKSLLDNNDVKIPLFNHNLPSEKWARDFLKCHKFNISEQLGNTTKTSKLKVSPFSKDTKTVVRRRRKKYSDNELKNAIAAMKCKENPMTVREAACAFSIPKSTLCDVISSKYNHRGSGKKRLLTDELEEKIIKGLVLSPDRKLMSKRLDFRLFVKDVLDENNVTIPVFNNNLPGGRWTRDFLERHKLNITDRLPTNAIPSQLKRSSSQGTKPVVRRCRKKHSKEELKNAIAAVKCEEKPMTVREAACTFSIPKSTLYDAMTSKYSYQGSGKKRVLSDDLEEKIVNGLALTPDGKLPSKRLDFRLLVKDWLDNNGVKIQVFNNNLPGERWAREFLKRHECNVMERFTNAAKQSKLQVEKQQNQEPRDNLNKDLLVERKMDESGVIFQNL